MTLTNVTVQHVTTRPDNTTNWPVIDGDIDEFARIIDLGCQAAGMYIDISYNAQAQEAYMPLSSRKYKVNYVHVKR
jgi:hypothetical protein